jgi:osmotically-inducible protein OsmY
MKAMPRKSDTQIQADVQNELRWDTRVNVTDVGVSVQTGVVTLSGTVDSWAKRYAAQQAAHRVSGVLDVANDIEVRLPGSLERSDAEIARAARQALEWDVRVPQENIQTTVSKGVITLEGVVNYWSQRSDAEEAVRYLSGVKAVNNVIAVNPPKVSPADVRKSVTESLARQAQGEAKDFDIEIHNGSVTLTGAVHSWAERQAAVSAAGATPGVRSVHDHLRVEPWH